MIEDRTLHQPAAVCAACGETRTGPYCARCGQKHTGRIALGRVFGDLQDQIVGLDFRLLRTAREILVAPGAMLRAYLAGRRIPYVGPIKLLFLVATLYTLVVTLLDVQLATDPGGQRTATTVAAFINYLVFVFLIPTAALLRLLFRRAGLNLAESYVVVCYLWAGYLLLASALAPVLSLAGLNEWFFPARTALGVGYVIRSLKGIFGIGWWPAIWRGSVFFAGYFVAAMIVMGLVVALAYLVGFEPLQLGVGER